MRVYAITCLKVGSLRTPEDLSEGPSLLCEVLPEKGLINNNKKIVLCCCGTVLPGFINENTCFEYIRFRQKIATIDSSQSLNKFRKFNFYI